MAELVSQTVEIGTDAYGRKVTATRRRNYDGKVLWQIRSEPFNQRDDGELMDGLSDQNIRDMARLLDFVRT